MRSFSSGYSFAASSLSCCQNSRWLAPVSVESRSCPLVRTVRFHSLALQLTLNLRAGRELSIRHCWRTTRKKTDFFVSMFIKPITGLPVLLSHLAADPDHVFDYQPGGVGDEFAQSAVIPELELLLDDKSSAQ